MSPIVIARSGSNEAIQSNRHLTVYFRPVLGQLPGRAFSGTYFSDVQKSMQKTRQREGLLQIRPSLWTLSPRIEDAALFIILLAL